MESQEFTFSFPFSLRDRIRAAFLIIPDSKVSMAVWCIWPLFVCADAEMTSVPILE
jgi:hypothetical protein